MQGYANAILGKSEGRMEIQGSYTLRGDKLYSNDRPVILHIRKRKHLKNSKQTPLFLAIHQPSFKYVSNLYPQRKHEARKAPVKELTDSCIMYLDDNAAEYEFKKQGDNVEITKIKTKSGKYQAKELASV